MSETLGRRTVSESQVEAMVSLLSDQSETVLRHCRKALLAHPRLAEPLLRERLREAVGLERSRIEDLLRVLVAPDVERRVREHVLGEAPDLEQGSILIGRLVDPGAVAQEVSAALDAMADQVMAQLRGQRDGDRDLEVLRQVLVEQNGLTGIPVEQARPPDALLQSVTTHRRGLPLPLCMAWVLVARRARIPIVGVNFPGHFLVRYALPGRLLVLDPFHGGRPVELDALRRFLASQGLPGAQLSALDAKDVDMLLRTLRNLVNIGAREGERELVARCSRVLSAASERLGS